MSFFASLLDRPEMEFQGGLSGKRARLNHPFFSFLAIASHTNLNDECDR
jgi:hypothetical protein